MALSIPSHFNFKFFRIPNHQLRKPQLEICNLEAAKCRSHDFFHSSHMFGHKSYFSPVVLTRASSDSGGLFDDTPQQSIPSVSNKDTEALKGSSSSLGDGYVSLFIRMLGLDNDPLDREQAVVALWKYSLGGKQYIDNIMQFHGCINLIINLLKSDSSSACEAAAGLLRTISSVNSYRNLVAESGAIEAITGLLRRSSLSSEVKEQCICSLWNLSVDEKYARQITNSDLLPLLIMSLDDDEIKVKEAAGGVLANLSLCRSNHNLMVEAGVIPKLANFLKVDEGSKVIRKEAKNALLELAKDEYYKILVIEEGLVLVPLIGITAYKSFRPVVHSWPSLPDGTEIEQNPKQPSKFGASELLLGLNIEEKNIKLEEAKMNAIMGRTHQQFLARIGAIEMEDGKEGQSEPSTNKGFTLLPWRDGVARLVLILELQDESAIARAAESIADASVNEHMRVSFKEAGAVKHLVQLLEHPNDGVRSSVTQALERLSVSNEVCRAISEEGVLYPLLNTIKQIEISENLLERTLYILMRILEPAKEMKLKFYDGPINGSRNPNGTTGLAENIGEMTIPESNSRKEILDSAVIARLVEILRTSSPNLKRKCASILEYALIMEPCIEKLVSSDIESALDAVFQLKYAVFKDTDIQRPETALEIEEASLAVSAASRLLTKLLDFDQFPNTHLPKFTKSLRKILESNIPLPNKKWVATCLVKLTYLTGPNLDLEKDLIKKEVTIYETIPRLIDQLNSSVSLEVCEEAVLELNKIVSEDAVDSTRAVAAQGGIFPLVKLVEQGTEKSVEAGLGILYNLSMDSENHLAILAAGVVPILKKIVLAQKPQWKQALDLLRNLPT